MKRITLLFIAVICVTFSTSKFVLAQGGVS